MAVTNILLILLYRIRLGELIKSSTINSLFSGLETKQLESKFSIEFCDPETMQLFYTSSFIAYITATISPHLTLSPRVTRTLK